MKIYINKFSYIIFLSLLYMSCSSLSSFDQTTIDQASSIKIMALSLMDKATNPYPDFVPQVDELKNKLDEAYQYSKSRNNNDETTQQWELLIKPDGHLLGGFLSRWQSQNKLSGSFVNQAKDLVSTGFDEIIEFENSKK